MNELYQHSSGPSEKNNNNALNENYDIVPIRLQCQTDMKEILPIEEIIQYEDKRKKSSLSNCVYKMTLGKIQNYLRSTLSQRNIVLVIPILYVSYLLNQYINCFVEFAMPILSIINFISAVILSLTVSDLLVSLLCRLPHKSSISSSRILQRPKELIFKNATSKKPRKKVLSAAFLLFFCVFESVQAIRITSVVVPPHQVSGESVELECHYDLESDILYSVKWYRGSHEFFRFVPADTIPMQVFDIPGVVVDTALSDKGKVTLRSVTRESSGKYKCEVSADAPSFHTVSKAAEMLVVDLPTSVPNITGGRTKYHVGDEVHVNCTSVKSRPAASLMWYINGKPAKIENLVEYAPVQDGDSLETSRLGLRFYVGAKDFPEGVLRIRCTATIAAVYWQSSEEAVEGQLPQTSPALESKGVYTGGSSPLDISSLVVISTNLVQGTLLGCFLFR